MCLNTDIPSEMFNCHLFFIKSFISINRKLKPKTFKIPSNFDKGKLQSLNILSCSTRSSIISPPYWRINFREAKLIELLEHHSWMVSFSAPWMLWCKPNSVRFAWPMKFWLDFIECARSKYGLTCYCLWTYYVLGRYRMVSNFIATNANPLFNHDKYLHFIQHSLLLLPSLSWYPLRKCFSEQINQIEKLQKGIHSIGCFRNWPKWPTIP